MLCTTCWLMLRGQDRRQWKGTYDLHFDHHADLASLQTSAKEGCGICRVLWKQILPQKSMDDSFHEDTETDQEGEKAESEPLSTASLAVVRNLQDDSDEIYRLDFKVKHGGISKKWTFVLKQIGQASASFRTPVSENTASGEVLNLALKWINECQCVKSTAKWYPTRLIDLRELKSSDFTKAWRAQYTGLDERESTTRIDDLKAYLVETRHPSFPKEFEGHHYVTLSHRWGVPEGVQPKRLTLNTLDEFQNGMRLGDLPKTFRDAIKLAAHMSNVRYIWIDSLCIVQDSQVDWLHESAVMQKVYSHSHLNISATFAENSGQGLYSDRTARHLWEDEVNLNIQGLPGSILEEVQDHTPPHEPEINTTRRANTWPEMIVSPFRKLFGRRTPANDRERTFTQTTPTVAQVDFGIKRATVSLMQPKYIRRCTIVDASLWDHLVNQASVNRRGWVLQERLLAPRVLHFCEGQIAWECSEFEAAEGLPPGIPNFQTQRDNVYAEMRTKVIDPATDGKNLRRNRLRANPEPDPHLVPGIYAFEIWNRIVETYSKTALTMPRDKLIALSGIASRMSESICADYIAGLWYKHLASQLLWRVEPVFHPASSDRKTPSSFENPSKRPKEYRAPSFSWAAIDADLGNGVVCGEVTDRDILIDIKKAEVTIAHEDGDRFGLVEGAKIELWGHVRRVSLQKLPSGRHRWFLCDREIEGPNLHLEKHTNVYLDSPSDDERLHNIFDSDDVYCLPVAKGERVESEESKYIFCLLLVHVAESPFNTFGYRKGTFKRIGMTKLSPWADKLAREHILTSSPSDINLPHISPHYDQKTGKSLICLV